MKKTILKSIFVCAFLAFGFVSCNNDDDPVVVPDTTITNLAANTSNLSILAQALNRAGLAETLRGSGPFTVFAPTNEAFEDFLDGASINDVDVNVLRALLLNHVISGTIRSADILASTYVSTLSPISTAANAPTISMFVQKIGTDVIINGDFANNGSAVIAADITASNGVIHIVDDVIGIPTIVNHVVANPEFDTLQSIVTSSPQSAVLSALSGITASAPATLFAPNNAAFTAATTGSGFAVGAGDSVVTSVLQYHVTTAGNVRSSQLTNNQVVAMLLGQNTTVILGSGTVDIRDWAMNLSRVVSADIQCSNGVIHCVNRVLQPSL